MEATELRNAGLQRLKSGEFPEAVARDLKKQGLAYPELKRLFREAAGKKRRGGTAPADQPGSSPAARATAYGPSRSWSCGGMSRCLCGGDRWAWSVPTSPRRCQRYMKSVISSSTAAATITISRAATATSSGSSASCR